MKNSIFFLLIALCLVACNKETVYQASVYDCELSEAVNSTQHPQHQRFTDVMNEYVKDKVGVQIAVRTKDQQLWTGAAGWADIASNVPFEPCTKTIVGSVSKIYTAVLIFQLQDEGLLDINDKMSDYLPQDLISEIANSDEATVRQLLDHTSGIPDYLGIRQAVDGINEPYLLETQEEKLRYAYGKPALFPVGERHEYSNTNYVLLGLIIEGARSMDLDKAVDTYIVQPLGLQNTLMGKEMDPIPEGVARPYWAVHNGKFEDITPWAVSDAATGDGGIATNMHDCLLFIEALFAGDLVSENSLQLMREEIVDTGGNSLYGEENWYGLGLEISESEYGTLFGHTGGTSSYSAFLMHFPEDGVTVGIAFNGEQSSGGFQETYDIITNMMQWAFE